MISAELTVDPVAASADWRVRLDVSPGWSTIGDTDLLLEPTEEGRYSLTFPVVGDEPAPDELVATLTIDDPSREFYGTIERRRFVASPNLDSARGSWAVGSTEVDAEIVEEEALVLDEVWSLSELEVELPSELETGLELMSESGSGFGESLDGGGASMMSTCSYVTRYVYGKIGFWDIRDTKANGTGARHPTCDTSDTTCAIDSANCCFRSVMDARVRLYSYSDGAFVDFNGTVGDGSYWLKDVCWEYGKEYRIYAQLTTHDSAWGDWRILNSSGATEATSYGLVNLSMNGGTYTPLTMSVNQPSNPNTAVGENTNLFMTILRTMVAMHPEDTRLRFGPSGTTDQTIKVRYYGTGTGFNCSTSEIFVPSGHAGAQTPIWLLGYIYNARVTGCSGTRPAYPHYRGDEYNWTTGEGNALVAGIPSILLTVSYWDPQLATNTSVYNNVWPCFFDSYNNTNRASAERNNFLAVWEFIDADTSNTSGAGTDQHDLTLAQVMNGLNDLRDTTGSPGTNGTSNEAVWVWVSDGCSTSETCNPGHVCRSNKCYTGTPHGENIRDWVDHIADVVGGTKVNYISTLKSSLCVGNPDKTYPFTGGYRDDGY